MGLPQLYFDMNNLCMNPNGTYKAVRSWGAPPFIICCDTPFMAPVMRVNGVVHQHFLGSSEEKCLHRRPAGKTLSLVCLHDDKKQ